MPHDPTPRFAFGRNWSRFLEHVDDARIADAEASIRDLLDTPGLQGLRVLDIGSGSGLFSLAAMRLGAAAVHSIDVDPDSVACTRALKARFLPDANAWTIAATSVLDADGMHALAPADLVYAWGVLHHTGDLWAALDVTIACVAPGGRLAVALYNDQGAASRRWTRLKRAYVTGGGVTRAALVAAVAAWLGVKGLAGRALRLVTPGHDAPAPPAQRRGMSRWHDLVDWVGGYPFEVSTPGEVVAFARARGLVLEHLVTVGGHHGCNQFVFSRPAA